MTMLGREKPQSFWPPLGWEDFGLVKTMQAQIVAKDPMLATITGLGYHVDAVPILSLIHI